MFRGCPLRLRPRGVGPCTRDRHCLKLCRGTRSWSTTREFIAMPRSKKKDSLISEATAQAAPEAQAAYSSVDRSSETLATQDQADSEGESGKEDQDEVEIGTWKTTITSVMKEDGINIMTTRKGSTEDTATYPHDASDVDDHASQAQPTPALDQYQCFLKEFAQLNKYESGAITGKKEGDLEVSQQSIMDTNARVPGLVDPVVLRDELSRLSETVRGVLYASGRNEAPVESTRPAGNTLVADIDGASGTGQEGNYTSSTMHSSNMLTELRCVSADFAAEGFIVSTIGADSKVETHGEQQPLAERLPADDIAEAPILSVGKVQKDSDFKNLHMLEDTPGFTTSARDSPVNSQQHEDRIRDELKHLQDTISTMASKCAQNVGISGSNAAEADLAGLKKLKDDLEKQNLELEAAVARQSMFTQPVDPHDNFFLKLDRAIATLMEERNDQTTTAIWNLPKRSSGKKSSSKVLRKTLENPLKIPLESGIRRAMSHAFQTESQKDDDEIFDREARKEALMKGHAATTKTTTKCENSVEEQLLCQIGQKTDLLNKIGLFLRLGHETIDSALEKEAQEKLEEVKFDINVCQAQLAVISQSRDLLAKVPIVSSAQRRAQGGSLPVKTDAVEQPEDAIEDVALDVGPKVSECISVATVRLKEAGHRFLFAGKLYLALAVFVAMSSTLAPYTIPAVPAVMLVALAIYQLHYAGYAISVIDDLQAQKVEANDFAAHDTQPAEIAAHNFGTQTADEDPEQTAADEDPEQTAAPILVLPTGVRAGSFVLSVALVISSCALCYGLYTVLDVTGTPACTANYEFQTRFSPLCQDPTRATGEGGPTLKVQDSGTANSSLHFGPMQSGSSSEGDDGFAVTDQHSSPSLPPAPALPEAPDPSTTETNFSVPTAPYPESVAETNEWPTATMPMIEPSGGDFVGYALVTIESQDDSLAFSVDGSSPVCNTMLETTPLKQKIQVFASSVVKARSCCETCADHSDIVIETYSILPGPVVLISFDFAETRDSEFDLDAFRINFAAVMRINSGLVSTAFTGARRQLRSTSVNMRILANSVENAAKLEQSARDVSAEQISEAAGDLRVSSWQVSIFDPAVVISQAINDTGIEIVAEESLAVDDQQPQGSNSCVNTLTAREYDGNLRRCNAANVCFNSVVKTTRWCSCDLYLVLSGIAMVILLIIAAFVFTHARFATTLLERRLDEYERISKDIQTDGQSDFKQAELSYGVYILRCCRFGD